VKISSIGDILWRAIDWHRSGKKEQSQKTIVLEQGLTIGTLSNEYPFVLDEEFLRGSRNTVRHEVIGKFEHQWEEVSSEEEEKEETRDLRSPREPEHPPSWIEFPNFPKKPSGPPPGHTRFLKESSDPPPGYPDTDTSPSNKVVIAKAKTDTGSVTPASTSSVTPASTSSIRSVQGDRKVTLPKASSPAIVSKPRPVVPKAAIETPQGAPEITTKSNPPVPKASSVASDSGPKAKSVLKEPPLPPPAKGSVARGLALQKQRSKSSSGTASSSSSVPVPNGQPLAPQYLLPDYCKYLTWDSQGKLRDSSTRRFIGVQGMYTELPAKRKFCLCLDWHQVLDRSRTQSAWAVQRVPKENLELLKRLKNFFGNYIVIAIMSHIKNSAKNEAGLRKDSIIW